MTALKSGDPLTLNRLYGRSSGHKLRKSQQELVDNLLPQIEVPADGEITSARLFSEDRPLHFEGWKTATEALGPLPYCKGELLLDRLRTELGEPSFWRGLALYTSRHARALVDSRDLQRAMEQASGRPLAALFDEAVYR